MALIAESGVVCSSRVGHAYALEPSSSFVPFPHHILAFSLSLRFSWL